MTKRPGLRRLNPLTRRPSAVEPLESRVLMSVAPAAPLGTVRAGLAAPGADAAPPVQGQVAQELVPGGVVLRSITPALPLGPSAGVPAAPPPREIGGAGLDIVLKKGPNLANNVAATAAFEQAALFFETIFSDPVTVVVDAEVAALPVGVIGATGSVSFMGGYDLVRDAVVDARAADEQVVALVPTAAQFGAIIPADPVHPFSIVGALATRANLLALGIPADQLPGPFSQYDRATRVDMDITFSTAFPFDYDRSDGIGPGLLDFTGVAIHEIAHGLGFTSEVDTVDFLLANPGFAREVRVSPLDLFRMRPGEGRANFTGNARVFAPGNVVADQVFYDGGVFNPAGFAASRGLTLGDVPMSTGDFRGDGNQASHWHDNAQTGIQIGLMDPTAAGTGQQLDWKTPDNRAMGLIGWDVDTTSPAVGTGTFLFESAPNRLRYAFSEPVQLSLGRPDLLVQRLEPGGPVTVATTGLSYDPATDTATFSFSGALPQGSYRATLRGAGVTDFAGNAFTADHVFEFFALAGDINRDRRVDSSDFATLAGNFGKTGVTYAQGDLTGDGRVDSTDFSILAGNFGRNVPAPAAVVAAPAAALAPAPAKPAAPAPKPAPALVRRPPPARAGPARMLPLRRARIG